MEKHSAKSGSFIGRHRWRSNLESHRSSFSPRIHHKSPVVVPDPHLSDQSSDDDEEEVQHDDVNVDEHQLLSQIDGFIHELSTADQKTKPQLPEVVEVTFSSVVRTRTRTRKVAAADFDFDGSFLQESVGRLSQLKAHFEQFEKLLHRVMVFLEEQLRGLLDVEDDVPELVPEPKLKVISSKHFSFKSSSDQQRSPLPQPSKEDDYPGFSHDTITKMNTIVTTMISAGYKNDCSNVYSIARGNALYEQLRRLDFEKLNADDLHKSNWDSLEADLARWIRVIKHCSHFLIPAERKLGESVFSHHIWVFRRLFLNLIRSLMTSLLDYAATVAMMKRSAEKLFKFLDMYEALEGLREAILIMMKEKEEQEDDEEEDDEEEEQSQPHSQSQFKESQFEESQFEESQSEESQSEESHLEKEISSMTERIGDAVVNMFADLEKSIRQDAAKTPVPGGAVHPLTRYVLNYLKYACDYGDTLDHIFHHNAKLNQPTLTTSSSSSDDTDMDKSPLAAQIASIMSLLDGNLAVKSMLYKDPSLRNIFLMNNGRYILQKVKGSNEIKMLMGDNWCRRRSSEVRHYHKSYQRETWARLLQCIAQEGIHVNGKLNKQLLKDRFKNFNTMFDDIHKTQSSWVVSDDQLQSELRASISAVVIPAYRSFVGRYKHHFDAGKNMDKYIKYQPEDIEALIETLFEGNAPQSMSRRRF